MRKVGVRPTTTSSIGSTGEAVLILSLGRYID